MEAQLQTLSTKHLEAIANNKNFKDKELLRDLTELFADRPEAAEYLYLYGELCETFDDLVDEIDNRAENVDKAGLLRCKLSVCPFWLKYHQHLWMVERLIHHQYADVVKWEHSPEQWKRRDSKALSHCAYLMLFAVIQLEFGDEKVREFSLRFREHAHLKHLNDPDTYA